MNNESTVNNDNGVTYTASFTHSAWIKGTVWSIGLGCEVQVVGHSSDQQDDVWMVTRDIDGDGSPDSAMSRAGSDLAPVYKIGDVVTILVQTSSANAPELTYGFVVSRSNRGVYLQTGYTMFNESGAVCIDWADIRTRFLGGEEFQLQHNQTATFLNLLHSSLRQQAERVQEARRETERANGAVEHLKDEVATKMKELAVEHGWCSVAREALEELDIEWPTTRWQVPVTFTGYVTINADDAEKAEDRVRYLIDGIDVNMSGDESGEEPEEGSFEKEVGDAEAYND